MEKCADERTAAFRLAGPPRLELAALGGGSAPSSLGRTASSPAPLHVASPRGSPLALDAYPSSEARHLPPPKLSQPDAFPHPRASPTASPCSAGASPRVLTPSPRGPLAPTPPPASPGPSASVQRSGSSHIRAGAGVSPSGPGRLARTPGSGGAASSAVALSMGLRTQLLSDPLQSPGQRLEASPLRPRPPSQQPAAAATVAHPHAKPHPHMHTLSPAAHAQGVRVAATQSRRMCSWGALLALPQHRAHSAPPSRAPSPPEASGGGSGREQAARVAAAGVADAAAAFASAAAAASAAMAAAGPSGASLSGGSASQQLHSQPSSRGAVLAGGCLTPAAAAVAAVPSPPPPPPASVINGALAARQHHPERGRVGRLISSLLPHAHAGTNTRGPGIEERVALVLGEVLPPPTAAAAALEALASPMAAPPPQQPAATVAAVRLGRALGQRREAAAAAAVAAAEWPAVERSALSERAVWGPGFRTLALGVSAAARLAPLGRAGGGQRAGQRGPGDAPGDGGGGGNGGGVEPLGRKSGPAAAGNGHDCDGVDGACADASSSDGVSSSALDRGGAAEPEGLPEDGGTAGVAAGGPLLQAGARAVHLRGQSLRAAAEACRALIIARRPALELRQFASGPKGQDG